MSRNEEKIKELKEEYMKVQPQKEGLKQLEQTIQRAKKDKRRSEKIRFFRRTAVSAAAAFAGVFVIVNVNSDVAYAMEKIPFLGKVISVITLEHYKVEGDTYSADIKTPKLESDEKTPGIDEVNKAVQEDKDALIAEYKEMFGDYVVEKSEEEAAEGLTNHYSVDADYEVITDNDDYFVLCFSATTTSASANQINRYYTIDRKSGEVIELKDLFQKDSNYIKVISDNIKEQMRQQMAEDENIAYWLDEEIEEWNFKEIKENQNFYINEKGNLVIAFDEYDVAPGYMGAVSFEIPKEALSSIWK